MASKSKKYYDKNPAAKAKKNRYQKKYNAKPAERRRRAKLNKENRDRGTYGNGDKLDVSHRTGKKTRLEPQSKNRGSKTNTAGDRRARGGKKK
jgi:hypothetical protein